MGIHYGLMALWPWSTVTSQDITGSHPVLDRIFTFPHAWISFWMFYLAFLSLKKCYLKGKGKGRGFESAITLCGFSRLHNGLPDTSPVANFHSCCHLHSLRSIQPLHRIIPANRAHMHAGNFPTSRDQVLLLHLSRVAQTHRAMGLELGTFWSRVQRRTGTVNVSKL